MNKAQAAALLLAGATAGVGGKAAIDAALGTAQAAPTTYFVHAVDLRRDYAADAGSKVHVNAYATVRLSDGGTKDVSRALDCKPSETTSNGMRGLMNVLGQECSWP